MDGFADALEKKIGGCAMICVRRLNVVLEFGFPIFIIGVGVSNRVGRSISTPFSVSRPSPLKRALVREVTNCVVLFLAPGPRTTAVNMES